MTKLFPHSVSSPEDINIDSLVWTVSKRGDEFTVPGGTAFLMVKNRNKFRHRLIRFYFKIHINHVNRPGGFLLSLPPKRLFYLGPFGRPGGPLITVTMYYPNRRGLRLCLLTIPQDQLHVREVQ